MGVTEASFRGAVKYPRPVYSPRDPVLSIPGESIVKDPRKLSIRGFDNLLEHLMDAEQPFARFYVHVNWEGSEGGHEFLILRAAPNRYYVMDSQAGTVDPLTDEHPYFKKINWENSYICRLDNKNFNYRLFDKMNDPKITLAWNPDKDIPFMEKEGMISDACISYAMGVDKSIFELEKQGFIIKEDDGDYCVTFEYNQHDVWENYIRAHIKDTYWNEYIRLMNIDIVFLIKENNKIKRVTNHNYESNPELLATCNRLCEGNFKSIKELIFSNDFYKKNLEGRESETAVFYRELKKALKETPVQESATGVSNIKLRPATEKDLDQILKWETQTMNKVYREDKKLLEKMRNEDKENLSSIKIITSDGKDIGMYQAYPIDEGEWWYIAEIYLIPQYRGHGIGSSLIRKDISKHDKLVLRVDPDNTKAMKLYKSLGFTVTKREKFSWIMRLDKTKRSKKAICEGMVKYLSDFKYGLAEKGNVHSASAHDYDTKYKLQSPEEFEHNGGGICYDYVEFMEDYLKSLGVKCKKYFISTETDNNDTHTFILVEDGKDHFIYPESSFELLEGVYEVKSYEEAALKIMDKTFDMNDNSKRDEIKYYVWEYSGHPPYGSDMKTCMEYFSKGDPIHEGTAMKIKRKD